VSHIIPVTVLTGAPTGLIEQLAIRSITESPGTTHAIVSSKSRRKSRQPPKPSGWISTKPRLARWGEGCGCCTVRADVATRARRLVEDKVNPQLLLALQLGEDLEPLLKTFTVADSDGCALSDHAQVQRLVVVVSADNLQARQGVRELYERIELAETIILVRKAKEEEDQGAADLIRALNPSASIQSVTESTLPTLDLTQAAQPFDLWTARQRASQVPLAVTNTQTANGIQRHVFRTSRPFHPKRLHDLLQLKWTGVARVHGPFWVASRPEYAAMLQVNGDKKTTKMIGSWWAAVPIEDRPSTRDFEQRTKNWHPEFGDRVQELSIVGSTSGVNFLRRHLEQALMVDDELSPEAWTSLDHPFPWPNQG